MNKIYLLIGLTTLTLYAGCSSSSDSNPGTPSAAAGAAGTSTSAGGSAGAAPRDPTKNCVKPGTPANEKGFGAYCDKTADCGMARTLVCSGDFGADANSYFCTFSCTKDSECGSATICSPPDSNGNRGCVPQTCLPSGAGGDTTAGAGGAGGAGGDTTAGAGGSDTTAGAGGTSAAGAGGSDATAGMGGTSAAGAGGTSAAGAGGGGT